MARVQGGRTAATKAPLSLPVWEYLAERKARSTRMHNWKKAATRTLRSFKLLLWCDLYNRNYVCYVFCFYWMDKKVFCRNIPQVLARRQQTCKAFHSINMCCIFDDLVCFMCFEKCLIFSPLHNVTEKIYDKPLKDIKRNETKTSRVKILIQNISSCHLFPNNIHCCVHCVQCFHLCSSSGDVDEYFGLWKHSFIHWFIVHTMLIRLVTLVTQKLITVLERMCTPQIVYRTRLTSDSQQSNS